jgi:hypothetical protein
LTLRAATVRRSDTRFGHGPRDDHDERFDLLDAARAVIPVVSSAVPITLTWSPAHEPD